MPKKKTEEPIIAEETVVVQPTTKKAAPSTILTLNADAEVETPESKEDTIWHEMQNAYRTRKILTGTLGKNLAIALVGHGPGLLGDFQ